MKTLTIHTSPTLDIYAVSTDTKLDLILVDQGISAGFPSPAQDFTERTIDLNKELIKNISSTFLARAKGESMINAGIGSGDLLVIDKSLNPTDGKVAICFIDGEFTVKRIKLDKDCCWLIPANDDYKPIKVTDENDFTIWGIVTFVIKAL